jgi:GxxExxY protein
MTEERDPQTYAIIGAAMEVHRELGNGFLEAVYQEALAKELKLRQIPFIREVELVVKYKGETLKTRYRVDFVCFEEIIVELKAISMLTNADEAQLINYLKATGYHRGLVINFGAYSLQHRRKVWGYSHPAEQK